MLYGVKMDLVVRWWFLSIPLVVVGVYWCTGCGMVVLLCMLVCAIRWSAT